MKIQSTLRPQRLKNSQLTKTQKPTQKAEEEASGISYEDAVVKGAFLSGGAVAGVGLGVVTGQVLGNLTGSSIFSGVGGVAGAMAGAGTALAMSEAENQWSVLKDVTLGWGGGTIGSAAGQLIVGEMINKAGQAAGLPGLAAAGPLIGTAAGAVVGGAAPFYGAEDGGRKLLRDGALATGATTAGLLLGTGARHLFMSNPVFQGLGGAAPVLGAAAGGALALAVADHKDQIKWANDAGAVATLGALGYGVGSLLGGVAGVGGSSLYRALPMILTPLWGAGALDFSFDTDKPEYRKTLGKVSGAGTMGLLGAMGGDVAGNLLTAATGQSIFRPLLPLAASTAASTLYLSTLESQHKEKFATAGATALGVGMGSAVGGLMGAGLSAVTGNGIYNAVGGVLGGATAGLASYAGPGESNLLKAAGSVGTTSGMMSAGVLLGEGLTALSGNQIYATLGAGAGVATGGLMSAQGIWGVDSKGTMEASLGAVGGTAAGVALGEGLSLLTGQNIWKSTLPVLGTVAGGLSGLAFDILNRPADGAEDQQETKAQ